MLMALTHSIKSYSRTSSRHLGRDVITWQEALKMRGHEVFTDKVLWNPTVKHILSFKHGKKKTPHAPSKNLNVMWGSPQAISFQDSIIDNYIIVIKQLNKFYLSLWRKCSSATIKMNTLKEECRSVLPIFFSIFHKFFMKMSRIHKSR